VVKSTDVGEHARRILHPAISHLAWRDGTARAEEREVLALARRTRRPGGRAQVRGRDLAPERRDLVMPAGARALEEESEEAPLGARGQNRRRDRRPPATPPASGILSSAFFKARRWHWPTTSPATTPR
jgi:hypothetical protein